MPEREINLCRCDGPNPQRSSTDWPIQTLYPPPVAQITPVCQYATTNAADFVASTVADHIAV
jgi:hypothetical protein